MIPRVHKFALTLGGAVVGVWLVAMGVTSVTATDPAPARGPVVAIFWPGTASEEALGAIVRAGGRVVGQARVPFVWTVDVDPGGIRRLREAGAVAVVGDFPSFFLPAGCIASWPSEVRMPPFR